MTTPTLEDQLAAVLWPITADLELCDGESGRCRAMLERTEQGDWVAVAEVRPAILTLIRTLLREERERCAALCSVRGEWREGAGEFLAMQIRALGDRP